MQISSSNQLYRTKYHKKCRNTPLIITNLMDTHINSFATQRKYVSLVEVFRKNNNT